MSIKLPGVTVPFVNQGGVEACLTSGVVGIPMTIDGATARRSTTVGGPSLFARQTAAPYKALPFMSRAVMTDITNVTNFVCDVPDADREKFNVGDKVKFYDISAAGLDAGALTSLTIDIVSVAGGGTGGAGFTKITCTAEVFTNTPATSDLLVLADGTELSTNAVVVLNDVAFDGVADLIETGYIEGTFKAGKVANTTYFVAHENQKLQFVNIV